MTVFQILDECPACRVESAVTAMYDHANPACLLGVAAESRCRMCGRLTRGAVTPECITSQASEQPTLDECCPSCGKKLDEDERVVGRCESCGVRAYAQEIRHGETFNSLDQLQRALARWGAQEGYDGPEEFVANTFLETDMAQLYERMRSGKRVETNLDVLAFLFPEVALAAAVGTSAVDEEFPAARQGGGVAPPVSSETVPPPALAPEMDRASSPPPVQPQAPESGEQAAPVARTAPDAPEFTEEFLRWGTMLPLVSVMVADGRVHPEEEAFITRVLARHKMPPVPGHLVRVHRPETVPFSESMKAREAMLESMVHLVHVDRLRDGTEIRVVDEYARYWGIPPQRVTHWDELYRDHYATGTRRLWMFMHSLFTRK